MSAEPNRTGLDYRAGYVEALARLDQILVIESMRGGKKETAGLAKAQELAKNLYDAMVLKIVKGDATE